MFCSQCGTKNNDDAKFCSSCGTSTAELTIAKATPPTKFVVRSQTYRGKTIREWSDGSSSVDGMENRTFALESWAKAHVNAQLAEDSQISPINVAKKSFFEEHSKALVIVGVLAVALGAILLNKPGDSATVKKAKETILSSLRDPSSAEFRNIIEAPEDFVCGEVNAKNAFGAYIGFATFTYDGFTEKTCFDCAELDQSVCTNKVGGRVLRQERYLEGLRRMSGTVTVDWLKKSLEKESIPLIAIAEKTLLEIREKYPSPSTSASTSPAVAPSAPTPQVATAPRADGAPPAVQPPTDKDPNEHEEIIIVRQAQEERDRTVSLIADRVDSNQKGVQFSVMGDVGAETTALLLSSKDKKVRVKYVSHSRCENCIIGAELVK